MRVHREIRVTRDDAPGKRRDFLRQASLAGLGSLVAADLALSAGAPASAEEPDPAPAPAPSQAPALSPSVDGAAAIYYSLGPGEAAFVEAMVEHMCPADAWSAGGVDCGLAAYIDRQLAGPFGKGAGRYHQGPFRQGKPQMGLQLPLTPEQFFKSGLAAVDAVCVRERGAAFAQLAPADAEAVLNAVADGRMTDQRLPLGSWFNELVYPLFIEACFADPIYGGNRDAVFWKMLGYPGLPATHTLDMVRYRGKPYPGALSPKSIGDFT